jgi:hypothetical protein
LKYEYYYTGVMSSRTASPEKSPAKKIGNDGSGNASPKPVDDRAGMDPLHQNKFLFLR